jgi:hypothetical protein
MPEKDDEYDHAIEREVHVLESAHSPVSRIVYVSAYGTGRYETLWLAIRQSDLDTPLPDDAKTEEAAARGLAEQQIVHNLRVRQDLGSR